MLNVHTLLFCFAIGLAVSAGPLVSLAHAKPPSADDRPSVEKIHAKAKQDLAQELAIAAAEKRDPIGEAIKNYRAALVPIGEYQQLVDVLLNDDDEKLQPYRRQAMSALRERFSGSMEDPAKRAARRDIGLAVCKLMKAQKDPEGVALVEELFLAWWRRKLMDFRFRGADKSRARSKAYTKMKRYLEKEEK